MKVFRYTFYTICFLILVIPSIPIPFENGFLSNLLGGRSGGLITLAVFFLLLLFLLVACCWTISEYQRLNKNLTLEIFSIPLLIIFIFLTNGFLIDEKPQKIILVNSNKPVDEFRTPFLSWQMLDCRKFTEEFDVIFVPRYIGMETEYLAYSPRRKNKVNQFGRGQKLSDDWYLEYSGSMWGDDLRKCHFQGKNPF